MGGVLSAGGIAQEVFAANQPAFDQLIDAAGRQPGAVPVPGPPVCAECGGKNGRHLSTCSTITGRNKPSTLRDLETVGPLAKQHAKEKAAVDEVERLTREVEKCDASIAKSQGHIAKAKEVGRIDWEDKAKKNLRKAEHAKKTTLEKLREAKLNLDLIRKNNRWEEQP